MFDGRWLLVPGCPTIDGRYNVALFSTATGAMRTVFTSDMFCNEAAAECSPVELDADWLEFVETRYQCTSTTVFQNLRTGEQRPPG